MPMLRKVKIGKDFLTEGLLIIKDGDGYDGAMQCWRINRSCTSRCAAFYFDGMHVNCLALPGKIAIIDNEETDK